MFGEFLPLLLLVRVDFCLNYTILPVPILCKWSLPRVAMHWVPIIHQRSKFAFKATGVVNIQSCLKKQQNPMSLAVGNENGCHDIFLTVLHCQYTHFRVCESTQLLHCFQYQEQHDNVIIAQVGLGLAYRSHHLSFQQKIPNTSQHWCKCQTVIRMPQSSTAED